MLSRYFGASTVLSGYMDQEEDSMERLKQTLTSSARYPAVDDVPPFTWTLPTHRKAPKDIKDAVLVLTALRTLHTTSTICLLPNELLFHIYWFLQPIAGNRLRPFDRYNYERIMLKSR